jgi:hypothetical protein
MGILTTIIVMIALFIFIFNQWVNEVGQRLMDAVFDRLLGLR